MILYHSFSTAATTVDKASTSGTVMFANGTPTGALTGCVSNRNKKIVAAAGNVSAVNTLQLQYKGVDAQAQAVTTNEPELSSQKRSGTSSTCQYGAVDTAIN